MDAEDLVTGTALKKKSDKIAAMQTVIAAAGTKAQVIIVDANNNQIVSAHELAEVLGDTAYNTQGANAKTAMSTALASAKSTADTAFAALGES